MNFSVRPTEMIDIGNDVIQKTQEFENLIRELTLENENIKLYWHDNKSKKYEEQYEKYSSELKKLATIMNELGSFIKTVGETYTQLKQDNISNINEG